MTKNEIYKLIENTTPAFFGLGFIQCKINFHERVHFYHPELVPTVNIEEEIHDHRYDFTSKVLKGSLRNRIYCFGPFKNGSHYKQSESCNEHVKIEDNPKTIGHIFIKSDTTHHCGESYSLTHDQFHTVSSDICITHLTRTDYKKELSHVIRPLNGQVICPFSKKLSIDECWKIIEKCLNE